MLGILGERRSTAVPAYESAARQLKIQTQALEVKNPQPDFAAAFQTAAKSRINGVVTVSPPLALTHRHRIAELLLKHQLPSMHSRIEEVEAGGLMTYTGLDSESFRRGGDLCRQDSQRRKARRTAGGAADEV